MNNKMEIAYREAQETFKYFWRELSWEYRRIVPALDMAIIKVAFYDESIAEPNVEYMWVNEVEFDGKFIKGVLINQPNYLTNVQEGDAVTLTLDELCDWMYVTDEKVCGAFTINVLRSEMSEEERREHDEAWNLNFANPSEILLTIYENDESEHPMSVNREKSVIENLESSTKILDYRDALNGTMLHYEALAGNALQVKSLLKYGADANLKNDNGMRAIDLAKIMNWTSVIEVLDAIDF